MIPTPTTLSTLFQVQRRFAVPLYQRQYVWKEENHNRLWEMLTEKAEHRAAMRQTKPRFLGTVVLSPYTFGTGLRTDLIVDGQQRLTTLQIFLAALRDISIEHKFEQLVMLLDQMTKNIVAPNQPPEDVFKVTPTKLDRPQFELCLTSRSAALIEQKSPEIGASGALKLVAAYKRFRGWIGEYLDDETYGASPEVRAQNMMGALMTDLLLVSIDLNNGEDPQEIFETLNFGGTPLAPSDLLRNWLLLRANERRENMNLLYETYWQPFDATPWTDELSVGRRSRMRVDVFMHHYLTSVRGESINAEKLYSEYKEWSEKQTFVTVEEELKQLQRFSVRWLKLMSLRGDAPVERLAHVAVEYEVGPAIPLLLALTETPNLLSADRDAIATDVESYIVRREICRLTAKNYNNTFLGFIKLLKTPSTARAQIRDQLLLGTAKSTKWPVDREFVEAMAHQRLYDRMQSGRLQWFLWELELAIRTKKTESLQRPAHLQIEHILPVAWQPTWKLKSGELAPPDYDSLEALFKSDKPYADARARDKAVDTIGNLTLITGPLNQSYGNDPFSNKKAAIQEHSILRLSTDILKQETWDVEQIASRSSALTELALKRWPRH